jgi:hypothetical protein
MKSNPVTLTVVLQCADGSSAEFCQHDAERVEKCLRLLAAPRLFAEPQLLLSSALHISAFSTRNVDAILACTSAPFPAILPLATPAGALDIQEAEARIVLLEEPRATPAGEADARTFHVEVYTLGGWIRALAVRAAGQGTVHDRRQASANILRLPVIPFRLREGGIGFINPRNIVHATSYPPPEAVPETALPMAMMQRSPPHRDAPAPRAEKPARRV